MRINFGCWVKTLTAATAMVLLLGTVARCEIIANSIDDWSPDGDQGVEGWTYGYFNSTADGDPFEPNGYGYATDLFIPFDDEPDDWEWTGTTWDSTLGNVPWTTIGAENGHPNGDNNGDVHFAMRRWESDFAGTAYLTSNLAKQNVNGGNGTSVHLYHNGVMLDEISVAGTQADFNTSTVEVALAVGDIIDFGLSSLGLDGTFVDGSDGSFFNLEVSDVKPPDPPEPPETVASTREGWSFDGEQGANGWSYGFFSVTFEGDPEEDDYGYSADKFVNFEDEDVEDDWLWNGNQWDSTLGDVPWTEISQQGGHPNGDNNEDIQFAIRRWESDTDGEVEITSSLAKANVNCGNGTSVHVFQNGELLDTITVASDQAQADESTITATLATGDFIDFALSPLGTDDTFADGCDGSIWYMDIFAAGSAADGDYNENGVLDADDLDLHASEGIANQDLKYDANGDGTVDTEDRVFWTNELKNTWMGDSDLNGVFDSSDFVLVFGEGRYETGESATWGQGDWDGDQKFDSGDFVAAFANGGYEMGEMPGGPNPVTAVVPEPSSMVLALISLLGLAGVARRRNG